MCALCCALCDVCCALHLLCVLSDVYCVMFVLCCAVRCALCAVCDVFAHAGFPRQMCLDASEFDIENAKRETYVAEIRPLTWEMQLQYDPVTTPEEVIYCSNPKP